MAFSEILASERVEFVLRDLEDPVAEGEARERDLAEAGELRGEGVSCTSISNPASLQRAATCLQ